MPTKRIAFNLMFIDPGGTGGAETYAVELIPRIAAMRPEVDFVAYLTSDAAEIHGSSSLGCEVKAMPARSKVRWQWPVFEQLCLPAVAARDRVDMLHSMALVGPVVTPRMRHFMTVHDVTFLKYPGSLAFGSAQRAIAIANKRAIHRSERVVTDSEHSKREIVELVGYPASEIDVIPLAGRGTMPEPAPIKSLAGGRLAGKRYVMAVGSLLGHKNMPTLLESFSRLDPADIDLLVLPGYDIRQHEPLQRLIDELGIDDRVVTLGWVSDPELAALYRNATLFVHVSLREGFGLPILEAMEIGVPVATSDATSLPEVGGDAVAYFDAADVDAIVNVVTTLLRDDAERDRLARAGRERAASFSWDRTAAETVESYRHVIDI